MNESKMLNELYDPKDGPIMSETISDYDRQSFLRCIAALCETHNQLSAANARIAELEKTIRALVDDGWLAHGPEGMSDVQKSLYEAIRGDGA